LGWESSVARERGKRESARGLQNKRVTQKEGMGGGAGRVFVGGTRGT